MKVKILLNLGRSTYPKHPFLEGDLRSVADELGTLLVKRGHAEKLGDDAVTIEDAEAATKAASEATAEDVKKKSK